MQITAAEFTAILCALIGLLGAAGGYAWKVRSDLFIANREINRLSEQVAILASEKAHFEQAYKQESEKSAARQPEKLNYPRTYVA